MEARELNDRLLELFPNTSRPIYMRAELELLAGNISSAEVYLKRFLAIFDTVSIAVGSGLKYEPHLDAARLLSWWAFFTGRDDLLDRAEDAARLVLEDSVAWSRYHCAGLLHLGRILAIRGDAEASRRCYSDFSDHCAKSRLPRKIQELGLGMTASTAGMDREARDHFARSWDYRDEVGFNTHIAVGFFYSSFLARQRNKEDTILAREIAETALAESRRYKFVPWTDKLNTLMQEIDSHGAPRSYPDGLSEREVEVLRLVAEGLTDRQIGEKLFISPKTVGNHLTHIREKIECRSRAEIARYAAANKLIEE